MKFNRTLFLSTLLFMTTFYSDALEKDPSPMIRRQETETKKLKAKLLKINVSDGINKREADTIAQAYFHKHVGCGYYQKISDVGDYWKVEGLFGRGAQPIEGFVINKATGETKSPIGPSYVHPKDIFAPPP